MKVEFSEKGLKEAEKIRKAVREIYRLQGIEKPELQTIEYHYELHLGSIGSTIYMVVPEFNIRVNITDYNKW